MYKVSLRGNYQRRLVQCSRSIVFHLYFGQNGPTLQRGFSAIAELFVQCLSLEHLQNASFKFYTVV